MALTTRLFPVFAALLALYAYTWPEAFASGQDLIAPLLGVVMLGMGLTLKPQDFKRILLRPRVIATGVALQFLLMPFIAWVLARAFAFPPELLAGMVLVGACPGGTASNVIAYLARADVALSVTLTTATTLLSVFLTPALTWFYAGAAVPVPAAAMLLTILYVIVIPVAAGLMAAAWLPGLARRVTPALPMVSAGAIVVIIAIVVALNRAQLAHAGALIALAVMIHNLSGFASSYGLARLLRANEIEARTIAIEVGMQNSGLGVALAVKYFAPQAALPGAIFSIWHNLAGAVLASFWARRPGAQIPPSAA